DGASMTLPNGSATEHSVKKAVKTPNSQTPEAGPAVFMDNVPSPSHKANNKLDMRPIRAELPPAFVPSTGTHILESATSFDPKGILPRPHHPSAGNIVFGGEDSGASSPAPPHSAGSAFSPPPYGSQGHSHHASEPYMQRSYPPNGGPPANAWNGRYPSHMSQPPFFLPHPFRYPSRETFTPVESRQRNGHYSRSRSVSQTSSGAAHAGDTMQSPGAPDIHTENLKALFYEPKTVFIPGPPNLRRQQQQSQQHDYHHYHHHHHQHHDANHIPSLPPPAVSHPDTTADLENSEALRDHIYANFANPTLADCHLQIVDEKDGSLNYLDGHKLVLSRSPKLLQLIRSSEHANSDTVKTQVHVSLQGRYLHVKPFMECIKILYGGHLLPIDHSRVTMGLSGTYLSNDERIRAALEYIATGAWLKVPTIAAWGIDIASTSLHWDTVASVLSFALDGGLSSIWNVEDGSEDKNGAGSPTYDPYSTQLLHRVVDFIVHVFPPNFYLDSSAQQLNSCPRLPAQPAGHETQRSRSDPRLSQIRFGEVPVDDHQRPSVVTTTISSVLLSLPFALLKCILEHEILVARIGADTVASIMRSVVHERELRRQKALKIHPTTRADQSSDVLLFQNLYWEEVAEPAHQYRAGYRLARRR
ncbi:hypothetical protein M433DRAFT_56578, partial [Acidomyces richmondensis BFW]